LTLQSGPPPPPFEKKANFCIKNFEDVFKVKMKKKYLIFSFDYGQKYIEVNHTNRKKTFFCLLTLIRMAEDAFFLVLFEGL